MLGIMTSILLFSEWKIEPLVWCWNRVLVFRSFWMDRLMLWMRAFEYRFGIMPLFRSCLLLEKLFSFSELHFVFCCNRAGDRSCYVRVIAKTKWDHWCDWFVVEKKQKQITIFRLSFVCVYTHISLVTDGEDSLSSAKLMHKLTFLGMLLFDAIRYKREIYFKGYFKYKVK